MQILPVPFSEIGDHLYREVMPGVYACPESGRLLISDADADNALLILLDSGITADDCHNLEEAIREAL